VSLKAQPPKLEPNAHPFNDRFLFVVIGLVTILLACLSFLRYIGYNAGMLDLGNMAQAISSVLRGQPLVSSFPDGPISRLALHVEAIYLLIVPFYALWPDPRLLLAIQALLFGLGALPVYRMALRHSESRLIARCLVLIYLFYPTAQTSVLFDFHGDTLAMPILLFALDALDRKAMRSYWIWLGFALICKFYVAAPVALLGLCLWFWGDKKLGRATFILGIAYGLVAFLLIRPFFSTGETPEAQRGLNYISFYFGQFAELWATTPQRIVNAVVVFGPALMLVWPGRKWLIPALPVALAALLSTGPGGAFDFRYHHYALVVPFIVRAAIEGVQAKQRAVKAGRSRRNWRGDTVLTAIITIVFSIVLVDTPFNPQFWLGLPGQGRDDAEYGVTARDTLKDRFLAEHFSNHTPTMASVMLATHIANRDTLYLVRYPDDPGAERVPGLLPMVDTVVLDSLFDWRVMLDDGFAGGAAYERDALGLLLQDPKFGLVAARDGLLLFERGAEQRGFAQQISPIDANPQQAALQRFGDSLELLEADLELIAGEGAERRVRARFVWRLLKPIERGPLVAVSQLEGIAGARLVHLPSYALLPSERWQPGQPIEEVFELPLPNDLPSGSYTWQLGWYDTSRVYAADTDQRSRVGELVSVQQIEVP
jgi:uncharacterized membrane protein